MGLQTTCTLQMLAKMDRDIMHAVESSRTAIESV